MIIPLVGGAYQELGLGFSSQTCINFYPSQKAQPYGTSYSTANSGKYVDCLWPTPGLGTFVTLPKTPIRGLYATSTTLYAVANDTFYSISMGGTVTSLGTLSTTTGRLGIVSNLNQILILDGTYGYVYTPSTNVFVQITDSNFISGTKVTYQDGYACYINNQGNFQLSALNDFLTYPANHITSTNTASLGNPIIGCETVNLSMFVFHANKTELWTNAGNAAPNFPFSRIPGILSESGCCAPNSILKVDNTIFWLSQNEYGDTQLMRANGSTPIIQTNEAMQKEFGSYTTISDAWAYAYQDNGHVYYVVTFPTQGKTWAFDVSTNKFHQKASLITNPGVQGQHRASCYTFWDHKHIIGDYLNGNVYIMSSQYLDDAGFPILRERTFPTLTNEQERTSVSQFKIDLESGVGIATGQGSNPRIMLQISRDGGKTFGSELLGDIGAQGDYMQQVMWTRLGQARVWTPRIRISDPVFSALYAARVDLEQDDK